MNKLKSFKDIAQENAMHLLKKELAKEAKKAAINPSDAEEASEEKTMYCKDCGCEKGKPDPDCTCENDCNNLTAAQCTTEKSKCKSRKEDVNELTIADVQKGTAMAKKRQEKEREAGKKSVSTADLAARMPKKEAHNPKHVKQAVGIASDPRYKGGNMTGATKVINKLSKGLSDHPQVKAVLKRQNEGIKTFDEISKGMASRYIKKAQVSTADAAKSTERGYTDSRSPDRDIAKAGKAQTKKGIKTFINRNKGTSTAVDKLTGKAKVPAKEGNVSEISNYKMGQYVRKAAGDAAKKGAAGDVAGAKRRVKGVDKAMNKIDNNRLFGRSEDVNEISQATKDRYVARASGAAQVGAVQSKYMKGDAKDKNDKMVAKRQAGIKKAVGEEMTMPMGKISKLPTYTNNKQNDDKKAEIRNDLKALRGRLAKLSRTKQEAHLDYNPAKGGYNQPKDKEVGKRVGTREDKQVKSADKRPVNVNVDGKIVTRMEPVVKRQADKEVSELSNHKMSQYRTKAYDDAGAKWAAGDTDKAKARVKGVSKATDKMDKNRVSELSNHTIDSYKKKAKVSINKAADTYDYKTAMKRTRGFGHVLNKAKKSGTNEDYKITKIYNPTTRKSRAAGTSTATFAVHTHDRKYFKEFPNQKDAEKHMKSMDKKK